MENTVLKDFNELLSRLEATHLRRRVAVVCPDDESTIVSVSDALQHGIDATLVCTHPADERLLRYADQVTVLQAASMPEAAAKGVALVRQGEADILMKGLINSDVLLHAILNRETGILPRGRVLTHLAVAIMANYPKPLFYTDAAVIPYPTQQQRQAQVAYMADFCRRLGISEPRIFDGPLDLKTSCSAESMSTKGITSPIAGLADVLIFPDIEAANIFHKAITLFCNAEIACLLQGTDVPVVMPSRSDSARTKLLSLAVGCYVLGVKS